MGVFQRYIDWILLKIWNNKKLAQLNFEIVYFHHEIGNKEKSIEELTFQSTECHPQTKTQ